MSIEKCPYCNWNIDNERLPRVEDDEAIIIQCSCGKSFLISAHLSYAIETDCALNGEKHDWSLSINNHECCENCDQVRLAAGDQ